jgi:hypothetical protein
VLFYACQLRYLRHLPPSLLSPFLSPYSSLFPSYRHPLPLAAQLQAPGLQTRASNR